MITTRRGYFAYMTRDVWRRYLVDVAIFLTVVALFLLVAAIAYVWLSGLALDDVATDLIVPAPAPSDYQLPTI